MKVYVIEMRSKDTRSVSTVWARGYKTLKAAQDFCMMPSSTQKLNDWEFESETYYFRIYEVIVGG